MSTSEETNFNNIRPIKLVIAALGGQGGGVLADWIAELAHQKNWPCQSTSVPGVAQRTGATIYYIEIFPQPKKKLQSQIIMSLFPTRGDVDIVIAAEIVEAGRMIERGFVTPKNTTLISSNHRVYAVKERTEVNDSRIDADKISAIALTQSNQLNMFDMQSLAEKHSTIISACLFGALCGTGVLPFEDAAFEGMLANSSPGNKNAFKEAKDIARSIQSKNPVLHYSPPIVDSKHFQLPKAANPHAKIILDRIGKLPNEVQETAYYGARKLSDYLDYKFAEEYLDILGDVVEFDSHQYALSIAFARQLALWSSFEDIIRVAHLKIKKSRHLELADEVGLKEGQVLQIRDFFKPRVEEMYGLMPYHLGRLCSKSPLAKRILNIFSAGKRVPTNHISIFTALYLIAGLRPFRRFTFAYREEAEKRSAWIKAVHLDSKDLDKALAIVEFASVIKGYGATRERGYRQMREMLEIADTCTAEEIVALRKHALSDDDSKAFSKELEKYGMIAA